MRLRDRWVEDLCTSAREGGPWYLTEDGSDFGVAVDTGTGDYGVYSVSFGREGEGWTTFVWDISESESVSMVSNSPWDGWASWIGEDLLIAMHNGENGAHEVHDLPGQAPFTDDEESEAGTDYPEEQWAALARIITQAQFGLLEPTPVAHNPPLR